MKKRRLAFVISSMAAGGAERIMATMVNHWAGIGHDVMLFTIAPLDQDHYPLHASIERVPLNLLWTSRNWLESIASSFRRIVRIRRQILGRRPEIVVSFIDQTNVRVLAALLGSTVPVLISERVDPRRHHIGAGWEVLRWLLYRFSWGIVIQTEEVRGWAERLVRSDQVFTVPNPIRELPAPHYGIEGQQLVLGIGRFTSRKGFDLLLDAYAESLVFNLGWKLVLLGDGPERQALEDQARRLGIEKHVEMPGIVHEPERYMSKEGVFVLSSRYEGFPNVLLEAMAMGMAVISFDCDTGPRDIVRHEINGLLIPPEDVNEMRLSIIRVVEDHALRIRLAKEAVGVRTQFSQPKIMRQWEKIIEVACPSCA